MRIDTVEMSLPYGRDNEVNCFGDYDTLVCRVLRVNGKTTENEWFLRKEGTGKRMDLSPEKRTLALENLFFQMASKEANTPTPEDCPPRGDNHP